MATTTPASDVPSVDVRTPAPAKSGISVFLWIGVLLAALLPFLGGANGVISDFYFLQIFGTRFQQNFTYIKNGVQAASQQSLLGSFISYKGKIQSVFSEGNV